MDTPFEEDCFILTGSEIGIHRLVATSSLKQLTIMVLGSVDLGSCRCRVSRSSWFEPTKLGPLIQGHEKIDEVVEKYF